MTLAEYRATHNGIGKSPAWLADRLRALARSWFPEKTKRPCGRCTYDHHVELAHIIPISTFPDTAQIGVVNSERNVLQLCRNCHWEVDHGLIDPQDIL